MTMIKLKKAWVNVKSLAETSDYYKPDNDDTDIALIEKQINKEKPIKPAVNNGIYYCYSCGKGCGYKFMAKTP